MRKRSPFPGMDPWLESYWNSVHGMMIVELRRQLSQQLPGELYAEIEDNVYVVDTDQTGRLFRPGVGIFDPQTGGEVSWNPSYEGDLAVAEPVRLLIATEPVSEGRIEIRDFHAGNKLVSVIEVLSPTNKSDVRGQTAYLSKRQAYYAADANVIEIDLLRGGAPIIGLPPEFAEPTSKVPYKCVVRRNDAPSDKTRLDYYRIGLRSPLPTIGVPLRTGDAEIGLDLRAPLDATYEHGRLGIRIDYRKPPEPALSEDDAAWAAELVARA